MNNSIEIQTPPNFDVPTIKLLFANGQEMDINDEQQRMLGIANRSTKALILCDKCKSNIFIYA